MKIVAFMRRSTFVLCCAFVSVALAQTPNQSLSPMEKLDIAERQKMLGERLTRTWAMKGLRILKVRAANQFEEDSKRYVRQLKLLQSAADTKEMRDNYELLEQIWSQFVELSRLDPGVDTVKKLADQNEELVWIAEKGAAMLRAKVGAQQTEGMRLAGEARSLSQRIAKLHFFRALGATAPFIAKDLEAARKDYLTSIAKLRPLATDRPKSATNLLLVEQQWSFFSEALRTTPALEDRDRQFEIVAKASDSLLSALEDLNLSFER